MRVSWVTVTKAQRATTHVCFVLSEIPNTTNGSLPVDFFFLLTPTRTSFLLHLSSLFRYSFTILENSSFMEIIYIYLHTYIRVQIFSINFLITRRIRCVNPLVGVLMGHCNGKVRVQVQFCVFVPKILNILESVEILKYTLMFWEYFFYIKII